MHYFHCMLILAVGNLGYLSNAHDETTLILCNTNRLSWRDAMLACYKAGGTPAKNGFGPTNEQSVWTAEYQSRELVYSLAEEYRYGARTTKCGSSFIADDYVFDQTKFTDCYSRYNYVCCETHDHCVVKTGTWYEAMDSCSNPGQVVHGQLLKNIGARAGTYWTHYVSRRYTLDTSSKPNVPSEFRLYTCGYHDDSVLPYMEQDCNQKMQSLCMFEENAHSWITLIKEMTPGFATLCSSGQPTQQSGSLFTELPSPISSSKTPVRATHSFQRTDTPFHRNDVPFHRTDAPIRMTDAVVHRTDVYPVTTERKIPHIPEYRTSHIPYPFMRPRTSPYHNNFFWWTTPSPTRSYEEIFYGSQKSVQRDSGIGVKVGVPIAIILAVIVALAVFGILWRRRMLAKNGPPGVYNNVGFNSTVSGYPSAHNNDAYGEFGVKNNPNVDKEHVHVWLSGAVTNTIYMNNGYPMKVENTDVNKDTYDVPDCGKLSLNLENSTDSNYQDIDHVDTMKPSIGVMNGVYDAPDHNWMQENVYEKFC